MNKEANFKSKLKTLIILLAIFGMSFNFSNFSTYQSDSSQIEDESKDVSDNNLVKIPNSNDAEFEDWWNGSFAYRRVINITNPYNFNFDNYGVSFNFSYVDLVANHKMNESLFDIRIVKDNALVKYYYEKDYPSEGNATVWFEADIAANTTSSEYFMYYGNNSVTVADSYYMNTEAKSFGWIKNGNFELDNQTGNKVNSYFGWSWSPDPPSRVPGLANREDNTDNINQHNITTINTNQSRVYEGKYSYKWGWNGDFINHTELRYSNGTIVWLNQGPNYHGTLYSNRFTIPTVTAQGPEEAKIYISLYRNIRASHLESNDGYFLRICRGEHYGSDPDNHDGGSGIQDSTFIEIFRGSTTYSYTLPIGANRLRNYNFLLNYSAPITIYVNTRYNKQSTIVGNARSPDMNVNQDGNLTGVIYIDVSAFQGQEIFLETGMVGTDNDITDSAFGQIDDIKFNYTLGTKLNEEQGQFAKLTVITKDVDGNIIPNAEVTLFNESGVVFIENTSLEDGSLTHTPVLYGEYNITVNYTSPNGQEIVVLNNTLVEYDTINPITVLTLHMWIINCEVQDWDGNPLNYGFVNVSESQGSEVLVTLDLNLEGNAIFYWKNGTDYYYEVYYDNIDYFQKYTLLNASTIAGNNVLINTNMSKLEIQIVDNTPSHNPVPGVLVQIINDTYGESIVNLTTNAGGYARGQINSELDFWYIHGHYNFSLLYGPTTNSFDFNVTESDQWILGEYSLSYNYSLEHSSSLEFTLRTSGIYYVTEFIYPEGDGQEVYWGELLSFQLNFTQSSDGGITLSAVVNPLYVKYEIIEFGKSDIVKSGDMESLGNGIFNLTFNSNETFGGKSYILTVYGRKLGYAEPNPTDFSFIVNGYPTNFRVHNYSINLEVLSNYQVSQYFGEVVNISLSYFKSGEPNARLTGAKLSYDWDYGSESNIGEDPLYPEYYTFLINTSKADETRTYTIDITIALDNYSTIIDSVDLNILKRITTLNGSEELFLYSKNIYIGDAYNFSFEYNDTTLGVNRRLSELTEASYIWVGNPSVDILLLECFDKTYILNYNSSTLAVGQYRFIVTMEKTNYDICTAIIDLNVNYRYFESDLDATNLDDDKINIVKGKKVTFEIKLTDPTKGGAPLTDANVILEIDDEEFEFDEEEPGVYELEFDTDDYEAFYNSETITGKIKIEKSDYSSDEIDITIVIEMEEIMPGIPTFYFILAVAAISIAVGSLISYKVIQIARLPRFVKKVNKLMKTIKSKRTISDSLLYPSKEDAMAKKLDDTFNILGLSGKDIFEVKTGKKIVSTENKKTSKSNGGRE